MEISREYFEKYLATSDPDLMLTLREKDKIRKRNRAKTVLRSQKCLVEKQFKKGDKLFKCREPGDCMYLVEKGRVDIVVEGKTVLTAYPGNLCGEHAPLTDGYRNSTAVCVSDEGCTAYQMRGRDFRKLIKQSPELRASLIELNARRDFKKAVVFRLKHEFPYDNPRLAFDAVVDNDDANGGITIETVSKLMKDMNPGYTDAMIKEVMETINLSGNGTISFEEFKKVFIADIKLSTAI
jgi:hypothetical protein